jgi:hypothetical protein
MCFNLAIFLHLFLCGKRAFLCGESTYPLLKYRLLLMGVKVGFYLNFSIKLLKNIKIHRNFE